MLTRLPLETIYHIFEYLDFEDIRSIACVCSAFRLPGQLRLFKTIRIQKESLRGPPNHTASILSSPHLLQYPSALLVRTCWGVRPQTGISIDSLWSHLPKMHRLSYVEMFLQPSECWRALSALESCGPTREIVLRAEGTFTPNVLISDTPLPVHTLNLMMGASGHQLAARVVQKSSQFLHRLDLHIKNGITPTLPFLPHLSELSLYMEMDIMAGGHDFISWFPFLNQHPTITRLLLCSRFTLTVQPSPHLLPNLQFLGATPAVIERLVPGRPVSCISVVFPAILTHGLPYYVDTMLRPLRQPVVPMTSLRIIAGSFLPSDCLIAIVQALPNLRKFILETPRYEVRQLFDSRRNSEMIGHRFLSPFKTC